ncbi:MAG: NADP-specific glutamate dehydrogenase [Candidatus Nanoarchaeia archaeon]
MKIQEILSDLQRKYAHEPEFLQAVEEVLSSIEQTYNKNPTFEKANIIQRLVEPDRTISFKVTWSDDKGNVHVNTGYRVQFNNALGPYKGGLRFHPSVTQGTLKFLGFEQIFKNSLTTLPLGGAKGGSDFDPRGKSDAEIMRFSQSFMLELWKHIGPETDVPAGDIGVGGREIGYLYGMYKKVARQHTGVLTGKGIHWGGSLIRPEATGFGGIYFVKNMLSLTNDSLKDKRIAISGFGNVAWGAALKAKELGAKIITFSGPDGYVFIENGATTKQINYLLELRASNQDKIELFAQKFNVAFFAGKKPWEVKSDIALPCATQNELNKDDAQQLINNDVSLVCELSNMGCTPDAISLFKEKNIPFGPSKAANAGGVAVSGLEMSQNSMKLSWTQEEVEKKLQTIMKNIHDACVLHGKKEDGTIDHQKGANIAGFLKVAYAMLELGTV